MTETIAAQPLAGVLDDRFDLTAAMWLCSSLGGVAFAAAFAVREPGSQVRGPYNAAI